MTVQRYTMSYRHEYLFYLIHVLNWDDDSQERFLAKHGDRSWVSAKDRTIDAAIKKMKETAAMFNVPIEDEGDLDVYWRRERR